MFFLFLCIILILNLYNWKMLVTQSCPALCDSMDCSSLDSFVHGDSPGKNTGVGCHALFQGIFPIRGSNLRLGNRRQSLYRLNHQGSPPIHYQFRSVISRVWLFATPWTAACQASLTITNSRRLFKLMSIGSVMPSNYLILCRSLLLLSSIFPSIKVFSNDSVLCIRWPKYWSFSFSISPSKEYSGLISSWIDWFDLLAVQVTLKSRLQRHSSKASILQRSAFFMVQISI